MTFNETPDQYREWLRVALDNSASNCEYHTRTYHEGVPYMMGAEYQMYRNAWDGYCIIVEGSSDYNNPFASSYSDKGYEAFLSALKEEHPVEFEMFIAPALPKEWTV